MENAKLDLQKNARLMSIEVRQAIQNVTDGYRLVETARLGCRQADESLRVTRDRYRNAMCSLTDLLDAQSQWQQAQSNLIEAQAQYKNLRNGIPEGYGHAGIMSRVRRCRFPVRPPSIGRTGGTENAERRKVLSARYSSTLRRVLEYLPQSTLTACLFLISLDTFCFINCFTRHHSNYVLYK